MHLSEVGILATTGAGLVEGDFRLLSDDPEARNLVRPDGARIAFSLGRGPRRTILSLVGDARRDSDGFYSAGPPVLEFSLGYRVMPSLEDMLANLRSPVRLEYRREGGSLATVRARHPAAGDQWSERLSGALDRLTIEAAPEDAGLRLKVEGELGPMTTHKVEGPVLARARLIADVLVPWAYLKVQASGLVFNEPGQSSERGAEPFVSGPTLVGVALNQFGGGPTLQGGLLFMRDNASEPRDVREHWVDAHLGEYSLSLERARAPIRTATGFVESSSGHGPRMTLFGLGYTGWSQMLEHTDTASLQKRGAGIGYVDQFTGRLIGDVGSRGRQPVDACQVELARRPEGLFIAVDGELGDVLPEGPTVTSLGRTFRARMFVPTAYILARNLPAPRYVLERARGARLV